MSDPRWQISSLVSQLEQSDRELNLRELQLTAESQCDRVLPFEGDAVEAMEILDRIERRWKALEPIKVGEV